MPVMNGLEFLEAFETIKGGFNPEVPIYVVSSLNDSNDASATRKYPTVKGYLLKHVHQKKLVEILFGLEGLQHV